MTTIEAARLLEQFRKGKINNTCVLRAFQAAPVAEHGFAQVDTHRSLRRGFPEVIFGVGTKPAQVVKIAVKLFERDRRVLVALVMPEQARALQKNSNAPSITNRHAASSSRKNRCPNGPELSP